MLIEENNSKEILLVIPAYKESKRISLFLNELKDALSESEVKVLIVDDGSGSVEQEKISHILNELCAQSSVFLEPLLMKKNRGKGAAILEGWKTYYSDFDYLGFIDADGACPASEVKRMIEQIHSESDPSACYFASRIKMLGRRIQRRRFRHYCGRIFATWVNVCLNIPVYDSQCGLKIISKIAFEKGALASVRRLRYAFDVELLTRIFDQGIKIVEVPIDWSHVPGSKVNLFTDSWRMFWDVWNIRKDRNA